MGPPSWKQILAVATAAAQLAASSIFAMQVTESSHWPRLHQELSNPDIPKHEFIICVCLIVHLIISPSKRASNKLEMRKLSGLVIVLRSCCGNSRLLPTRMWLMMISWPWPQPPLYHETAATSLHLFVNRLHYIAGAKSGIDTPSSTRSEPYSSLGRSPPFLRLLPLPEAPPCRFERNVDCPPPRLYR